MESVAWTGTTVLPWQQLHDAIEPRDVPAVFRPRFGPFQVIDEELVYAADERDDIFERRGVSRDGAVVVVRPDMFVSAVLPLGRPDLLARHFEPLLLAGRVKPGESLTVTGNEPAVAHHRPATLPEGLSSARIVADVRGRDRD